MTKLLTPASTLAEQIESVGNCLMAHIGWTAEIAARVETLVTLAHEHGELQEKGCNSAWSENDMRRDDELEAELTRLAERLPEAERGDGGWRVTFDGDPRGATVELHHPALSAPVALDAGRLA